MKMLGLKITDYFPTCSLHIRELRPVNIQKHISEQRIQSSVSGFLGQFFFSGPHMCLQMHVSFPICVHVYACKFPYVCMHVICMCVCVQICLCMHTCAYKCAGMTLGIPACLCVCACMHTRIKADMNSYLCIYAFTAPLQKNMCRHKCVTYFGL